MSTSGADCGAHRHIAAQEPPERLPHLMYLPFVVVTG
jgi:hypothetical protein